MFRNIYKEHGICFIDHGGNIEADTPLNKRQQHFPEILASIMTHI